LGKPTALNAAMAEPTVLNAPIGEPTVLTPPAGKPPALNAPMAEPTVLHAPMGAPTALNAPAGIPTAPNAPMAEPTVLNPQGGQPMPNDSPRAERPAPPNMSLENRLVAAAIDMLLMLTALRQSASHPNPHALQADLLARLRRFEAVALARGCAAGDIGHARYVLCAALDEAVLSTPWGAGSVWVQKSLLSQLHQENWGGERVFAILERSCRDPERHAELIELIDHCLALGFQGRFRLVGNGVTQLEELRRLLRRTLAGRGPSARMPMASNRQPPQRLGPDWSPAILSRGLPGWLPLWVVIVAALGGGLLAYSLFLTANDTRIDEVLQSIRAIAPAGP
jgi:type VI secretion system protein ImpK